VTRIESTRRPPGVTFVVVLTYISGVFSLVSGLVVVLLASNAEAQASLGAGRGVILAAGIFSIIVGIVTLLVAGGLRHGRRSARLIVTVIMALQIIGAIVTATGGQSQIGQAIAQIAVAAVVTWQLWSGPAKEFFRN
jgi:hypothetical protein